MHGFPKTLNSKEDYEYIKTNYPESSWKPLFQNLLNTVQDWFYVRKLEDSEEIPEGNYKTVDADQNDEDQRRSLYELKDNPTAKLFRLGYTKSEIEAYLQ